MWKKVVGPILLMALLWLAVIGAAAYRIYQQNEFNARILKENVSSIRAAVAMQASIRKLQAEFRDSGLGSDRDHDEDVREMETRFTGAREVVLQSAPTDVELELIRKIDARFADYRETIHSRSNRNDAPDSGTKLLDRLTDKARTIVSLCDELVQVNEELMDSAIARRSKTEGSIGVVGLVFLVVGPVLGIYVGLRIARNLNRSISRISVTLKDASGDLDQEIGNVQIVPARDAGDLSVLNDQVQQISMRIRQVLLELQKARQEAMRSDRLAAVGELAAGVAHEIRNPLTSVKLLMQTASPTDRGGIQLESRQSQVVRQEILRMEETVQALIDFARPPQLNRVAHDLRETIHRALNLVEGRARLERVLILPAISESPLPIDGDPEQLHQVFVNLMINGIESMPHGGALDVAAEVDDDPEVLRVTIADRGEGIPPERINRVFEPFFTTKPRGTGLGLAVSRRIVREHGGIIVAGNRVEGGAVFTVTLQAADATESPGAPDDRTILQRASSRRPAQGLQGFDHVASTRH